MNSTNSLKTSASVPMNLASSVANQTHKAFELATFAEKVPLVIECMTCYDNIFILGTNVGRMLVYEVKSTPGQDASFEKSISVTKKPIQELDVVKEFNILIALFDSQIHVFDLDKYQLQYSIPKTKNCSLFTCGISNDQKLLRLVVACRKKLQFFYLNNSNLRFMELISDLELNDIPKTLEITKENLVVFSLRKDFYYYEIPTSSAAVINKQPELKFNSGNRSLDPLCHKLYNDSFLIGLDENKSILYDSKGLPSLKYPIEWSSSPSLVANVGLYLIGLLPSSNCVEVLTFQPSSTSIQIIDFNREISINSSSSSSATGTSVPSSSSFTTKFAPIIDNVSNLTMGLSGLGSSSLNNAERIKILKSNGKSVCYVANQSNVWCLTPQKINDQLELAIRCKNFDLGLSLISAQTSFNEQIAREDLVEKINLNDKANCLKPFFSLKWLLSEIDDNLNRRLKNLHALDLFCRKKFSDSFSLFQEMRTDPSHLIAFLPGLLPDNYRSKLNLDEYYPNLSAKEQEEAIASLIDYLQFKRNEFLKLNDQNFSLIPLIDGRPVVKAKTQILQIIDTTLLKCYLKSKENLVQFFLRRDPNFLHLEESERLLSQHNKLNELIILYEKKEAHEKALNLLISESNKSNSNLYGLKHIVEYLKKLGNKHLELIFKYAKTVIESDSSWGIKIFIGGNAEQADLVLSQNAKDKDENSIKSKRSTSNADSTPKLSGLSTFLKIDPVYNRKDSKLKNKNSINKLDLSECIDDDDENLKELNHEQVFKFLDQSIEPKELSLYLVRLYLQYCIYVWNDKNSNLNNSLIEIYKEFIEKNSLFSQNSKTNPFSAKVYKQMLKYFLNETNNYEHMYALSRLDLENFPEERAVVLGKMGKHHDALSIYVNILNDTDKAEAYCEQIYSQPDILGSKQVFYELLQLYLNSDYEEIRIDASIRLLNAHSKEIGTSKTLELLPAQLMKCQNLSQFFENMLNRLVRNKHDTQIRNRLMVALQLQVHETKILCQDEKFVVNDEQMCQECNKRMGKSAMVRYPDGVLIHYGCLKNSEAHLLKTAHS